MGFLAELEQRIEGTIQRLFPRKKGEGVELLDIARLLTKAMESHRRVSVDVVYVPNHFEISVNPTDLTELQPVARTMERDALRHLERIAVSRGWAFTGPVELCFTADPSLSRGELRVAASFREAAQEPDEAAAGPTGAAVPDSRAGEEATRRFRAVRPEGPAQGAQLEVVSGPLEGAAFALPKDRPFLIGRHPDADLRLTDPKVSRRHALLRWDGEAWRLVDRGSTNGTLHNGVRIAEAALSDGDEVVVGLTALRFRLG